MRDEAMLFLVSCIVSFVVSPRQGAIPKRGYELFITLVGQSTTHKYHIHHWVYLVGVMIISGIARLVSAKTYRRAIAILSGIVASEFLKYTDVMRFSA